MNVKTITNIAFLFAMSSSILLANPVSYQNVRPVAVDNVVDPGEQTLQTIIDNLFGGPNVATTQEMYGMFRHSSLTPPGATVPAIRAEFNGGDNSFGIFTGADDNPANRTEVVIFKEDANSGDSALLQWDATGNVLSIFGDPTKVNQGVYVGISFFEFGFFFTDGANRFYTLDALNATSTASVLGIRRPGAGSTEFAFAFEEGDDADYNDMVVKVESLVTIAEIPEPSTITLLGTALLGAATLLRRKFNR